MEKKDFIETIDLKLVYSFTEVMVSDLMEIRNFITDFKLMFFNCAKPEFQKFSSYVKNRLGFNNQNIGKLQKRIMDKNYSDFVMKYQSILFSLLNDDVLDNLYNQIFYSVSNHSFRDFCIYLSENAIDYLELRENMKALLDLGVQEIIYCPDGFRDDRLYFLYEKDKGDVYNKRATYGDGEVEWMLADSNCYCGLSNGANYRMIVDKDVEKFEIQIRPVEIKSLLFDRKSLPSYEEVCSFKSLPKDFSYGYMKKKEAVMYGISNISNCKKGIGNIRNQLEGTLRVLDELKNTSEYAKLMEDVSKLDAINQDVSCFLDSVSDYYVGNGAISKKEKHLALKRVPGDSFVKEKK